MPSFIFTQRRNTDRLLALILLWNIAAGVLVTLGAPWLAEVAGATALRPVLSSGFGWLAIGVPTHFAGLWLPALGAYALYRMRRGLPWHAVAALFYLPQTFALTLPVHVDMWIGTFAATVIEPAIAVNWIAIALMLAHAAVEFHAHLERVPAAVCGHFRAFWGVMPLSRKTLARRYASIAMITAIVFLPLVPPDIFYPSRATSPLVAPHGFDTETVMFWRKMLLLPMTFAIAWVMAFVWSGSQREPQFSSQRGVVAAMLSYVYLGMATDVLSHWLSDGHEPMFRYFVVGFVFLMPWTLLVPVVGALTGARLESKVAVTPQGDRRRSIRLSAAMWLTLATPLLGLLFSF